MITSLTITYTEFEYRKRVKIKYFGVLAYVDKYGFNPETEKWVKLRNVDEAMFFFPILRERRAHKWADSLINKCLVYEFGTEVYSR